MYTPQAAMYLWFKVQEQKRQAALEDPPAAVADEATGEALPDGAIRRLGTSRLRLGSLAAFAISADGRSIVTVAPGGIVRCFDADTGRLMDRRLLSDRAGVDPDIYDQVQISEDGRIAATFERDREGPRITVCEIATGKVLMRRALRNGETRPKYVLSPDGSRLAVAIGDIIDFSQIKNNIPLEKQINFDLLQMQNVYVFDTDSGRGQIVGRVDLNSHDMHFSPDNRLLYTSQSHLDIDPVWAPDHKRRPDGPRTETYACFDVRARKLLWELPRKGEDFILTPDGNTLIAPVDHFGTEVGLQLIDTDPKSGKPTDSFRNLGATYFLGHLATTAENQKLLMSSGGEIVSFDIRSGEIHPRFKLRKDSGFSYGPRLGVVSADGKSLITNLGYLQRWDLATGEPRFGVPPDDGLRNGIKCLAFSGDGRQLVASTGVESACWDTKTGERLSYTREAGGDYLVATPDGFRTAGTLLCNANEIEWADPIAGRPLRKLEFAFGQPVHTGYVSYALTDDGQKLLVCWRTLGPAWKLVQLTVITVASGQIASQSAFLDEDAKPISPFSPDGRAVVISGKIRAVATGEEYFTPTTVQGERLLPESTHNNQQRSTFWSRDGRMLAGPLVPKDGGKINMLGVWDVETRKLVARIPASEFVREVDFARDGRIIAMLDGFGVRIRDLKTGAKLADYPAVDVNLSSSHIQSPAQTMVFSRDGTVLATGHRDGTVMLRKVPKPAN
jgi:WD40 repeat protein